MIDVYKRQSLGASENEVYFTSCGTESDNMALLGLCKNRRHIGKKIITTSVEHPAVLEPVKYLESIGFKIEYIGVDRNCRIDIKQLEKAITEDTVDVYKRQQESKIHVTFISIVSPQESIGTQELL